MDSPINYKRPALRNRPWINGALYDLLARNTILHADAYVFNCTAYGFNALVIEWREGGGLIVACDAYVIAEDGLTPLDPQAVDRSIPVYWRQDNDALMSRLHATVLEQPERMKKLGNMRWSRVSLLCHYVRVRERDCEIPPSRNHYVEYGSLKGTPAERKPAQPGRKRGRPRKTQGNGLPDIL